MVEVVVHHCMQLQVVEGLPELVHVLFVVRGGVTGIAWKRIKNAATHEICRGGNGCAPQWRSGVAPRGRFLGMFQLRHLISR